MQGFDRGKIVNFPVSSAFKRPAPVVNASQNGKKQRLVGGSSFDPSTAVSNNKLKEDRRKLPIFAARRRLLKELEHLPNAIVIGETGSGKTTQIPQYIYESGISKQSIIACTQPRRVAAITVAQRVAEEMAVSLGQQVGYCVRFDDTTSPATKVKYMTDGMLLREAMFDPLLKRYSVVILDEAHERTIHTDVLFGVVKSAQKERSVRDMVSLKIIVMSATMDVDHFSQYFNKAPVLYIEGRQHAVQLMYTCENQSDYLFSALVTVFQIHQTADANEDILVFLTGQEEIESMTRNIKDIALDLPSDCPPLCVCPMYAALPAGQQLKVFQPTPKGARKIIVSTNIAETSVTIKGLKHVIDTGVVKAKSFNPGTGLDLLKVHPISKAQAWQRSGRAGREGPGTCYRLYTEQEYEVMATNTVPEIQRCNLTSVVLQLMSLGITNILAFDFMDNPSSESLVNALDQLELLGALEKSGDEHKLTTSGRQMAAYPLDPRLSKVILAAKDHKCLEEVLSIVSLLSVESVLVTPHSKRDEAVAARKKFMSSEGDHLTMLNIYKAFKSHGSKQWCLENFVNGRHLKTSQDVRRQLREVCVRQSLPLVSCGQDFSSVRRCLCSGFFMSSAMLLKEGEYVTVSAKKAVAIHPSSCLFRCKPGYVVYNELVQTTKCYMRDLCVVDPDWLYEAAPHYFKRKLKLK